ncbi:MAG: hypothetical protein V3U82_00115 [Robiginitomaculum sp.]
MDNKPDEHKAAQGRNRPSERIFRRSRAARARRTASNKSDFKLITLLLQLSVLLALILVGLGAWAMKQLGRADSGASTNADMSAALSNWADPWLLGLSRIEIIGICALAAFSLFMLRRWGNAGRK